MSFEPGIELLYRDRQPTLKIVEAGRPWSFDSDGKLFRLVSEAHQITSAQPSLVSRFRFPSVNYDLAELLSHTTEPI
jgi:hypothetical protein